MTYDPLGESLRESMAFLLFGKMMKVKKSLTILVLDVV